MMSGLSPASISRPNSMSVDQALSSAAKVTQQNGMSTLDWRGGNDRGVGGCTLDECRPGKFDMGCIRASREGVLVNESEGLVGCGVVGGRGLSCGAAGIGSLGDEVKRDGDTLAFFGVQVLNFRHAVKIHILIRHSARQHGQDGVLRAANRLRREVGEFHLVELLVARNVEQRQQIPPALRLRI